MPEYKTTTESMLTSEAPGGSLHVGSSRPMTIPVALPLGETGLSAAPRA
jgi:hypothetical protein